jgi:hypothetical protein
MTIRCVADGGNCCGLKHIFGFGSNPDEVFEPYETGEPGNHEYGGDHGYRDKDAFFFRFPKQTARERLRDMLKHIREEKVYEVFQITLVDGYGGGHKCEKDPKQKIEEKYLNNSDWFSQREWFPIIRALGFRKVNRWYNSNSGNYVICFQLRMDPKYYERYNKKKKKNTKKPAPAPFLSS